MAGTPNVRRAIVELRTRFDLLYGVYNPRHISSNPLKPWSQHAAAEPAKKFYGNGIDIVHEDYGYSTSPDHQVLLDETFDYLNSHRAELGVRQILWRVRSHFNHIHVDFWPKMADEFWRRHPTKGGKVVVRYEDGTKGDTYDILPSPEEEDDLIIEALKQQTMSWYVSLAAQTGSPGGTPEWWGSDYTGTKVDGTPGPPGNPDDAAWIRAADELFAAALQAGVLHPPAAADVKFEVETVEVVRKVRVL